jgi:RNA polymerase sigma-70 factor (ECF subfamily)
MPERSSEEWLALLATNAPGATEELHELLLRIARSEANRRAPRAGITGAELDDLALQAADDATVAVLKKLPSFRGESRFTTWAFKFVILEVSVKVNRHPWRRRELRLEEDAWEVLPSFLGFGPEESVAGKELVTGIRAAIDELTPHQQRVFTAIVVQHVPLDELATRLESNRNAIYKTMFDARRKVRRFLDANGYLDDTESRRR